MTDSACQLLLSSFVRAPIPGVRGHCPHVKNHLPTAPPPTTVTLKIGFQNMGFVAHMKGVLWNGYSALVVRFAEDGHKQRFQLECLAYS